jgi:hypothetical protein
MGLAGCAHIPPTGDAWLDFSGVVSSPEGYPIEGAQLVISIDDKAEKAAVTDSKGRYLFEMGACPCPFSFVLSVNAPGFNTYTLNLDAKQALDLKLLNITLHPIELHK